MASVPSPFSGTPVSSAPVDTPWLRRGCHEFLPRPRSALHQGDTSSAHRQSRGGYLADARPVSVGRTRRYAEDGQLRSPVAAVATPAGLWVVDSDADAAYLLTHDRISDEMLVAARVDLRAAGVLCPSDVEAAPGGGAYVLDGGSGAIARLAPDGSAKVSTTTTRQSSSVCASRVWSRAFSGPAAASSTRSTTCRLAMTRCCDHRYVTNSVRHITCRVWPP
jgi:hypothetical protein